VKKIPAAALPFLAAALVLGGAGIVITQIYFATLGEATSQQDQIRSAEVEPLSISPDQFGPAQTISSFELGETIAKLYVPRFGNSYVRNIAEGTDLERVLNKVGIGRYIGTQLPGQTGNFAIAGHRTGAGGPMRDIDKFVPGDKVYVETESTWFTYLYLESKIVDPGAVGTIAPDPEGLTNKVANQKYLTMTSCTPVYVNTDRIIAWFALVEQQPVTAGMPEELAKTFQR
jgi:sortase A